MSRRAALPKVDHRRHLTRLQVINETGYDARAIRSLIVRALRSQGVGVAGAVRVVYSGGDGRHHGCAALGESVRFRGLNMSLSIPRDPAKLDVGKFARVIRHEVMHWRGVQHADMTDDQRYCRGATPAWAEGVVVAHREKAVPSREERLLKKCVHAHEMYRRAEARLKRAETIVKRWRQRVSDAELAIDRASEPKRLAPAPMAADGDRS